MISISLAQIQDKGNIQDNIENHILFINRAIQHQCNYILFPELSITGYIQNGVTDQVNLIDDHILNIFRKLSQQGKITISIGSPLKVSSNIYIASLIFHPNGTIKRYIKRFLHPGEEKHYNCTNTSDWIIQTNSINIASAICYDIENKEHINSLLDSKIDIYSASIFYTEKGINNGIETLAHIAKNNSINVIMANYVGNYWGMASGGYSGIWDKNGNSIIAADRLTECSIYGSLHDNVWTNVKIEH